MSRCRGDLPVTAKVDRQMKQFLDEEADRCGVTRAELIRRVFDDYKASRDEDLECPNCEQTIVFEPCP